ncbi:hypothetical protein AAWM_00337 [Aspergillus awamori]|uniref:HNH nuclease domain-containing protein n=1 Tax=Aspergillus awamori TaxID=105351 RepID=A0A401KDZ0_ASPAW|nr:hypothetical protein AAWM_00337 [Aspergillus awamori]
MTDLSDDIQYLKFLNGPRCVFLKHLVNARGVGVVPRHTWAALVGCDDKFLKVLLDKLDENGNEAFQSLNAVVRAMLKRWLNTEELSMSSIHDGLDDEKNTTSESNDDDDDVCISTILDQARRRDASKCAISSYSPSMLCEICPDHLLRSPATGRSSSFWKYLEIFWEHRRVKAWKRPIFADPESLEVADTMRNYITLSPVLRKYWEWGYFALRPNPNNIVNKHELKVQFVWLPQQNHSWEELVSTDLLPPVAERKAVAELVGFQSEQFKDLKSGDWITLTTPDPERLPLPSWELLELRGALTALVRMAGNLESAKECDKV